MYQIVPEYKRTNVRVNLDWDEYGKKKPCKIYWRDGREFDIKILSEERRPALKVGGCGIRYCVSVFYNGNKLADTYLFFEDGAKPETWFVEEVLPFDN